MTTTLLYPASSKEELQKLFVGKSIKDVPTPAAVLDLEKVINNCNRMLEAVDTLKFGWRAHIKTHKTTELTRLQVGTGLTPVNIIVSTLIEAENIVPLLLEYRTAGRAINLLYSFPLTPSAVPRLSQISLLLGPSTLSLLIDHPSQLPSLTNLSNQSHPPLIFLKIDMGGHRAGVVPSTPPCTDLLTSLLTLQSSSTIIFHGLYSHAGQSYASPSASIALDFLRQEFEALLVVAQHIHSVSPSLPLVLSVGATPTTTSIRNLLLDSNSLDPESDLAVSALKATIQLIRYEKCTIEIHAGVYPTLDIQQLSTHALPSSELTWSNLALTIVSEVASLYPGRGRDGTTEVLVGSGSLALGREPCKAYSGWGVVSPWNRPGAAQPEGGPEDLKGWYVGRISQEHGTLVWGGKPGDEEKGGGLEVGQKIRIWPNHACIAGQGFGWYLVVDGRREGREDEIVDVWPRWRGW